MGAKKVDINWKTVGRYLNAQCSGVSISTILGIHENTLYSRCKEDLGMEFMAYSAIKKAEGKELLRAKQFDLAMLGDRSLLIWLGKNLLGQKDQVETTLLVPQVKLLPHTAEDEKDISDALDQLENETDTGIHEESQSGNE